MGVSVTLPIICPTLVGRASHLATLQLLIEQAKQGEGHITLINGEAGIGKSRLIAEAKSYAEAQGFLLLQGNCFPTDRTYPYAPLLALLRSLVAPNPPAMLAASVETLAHSIFPLLPELVSDQMIPFPHLEPEQEKRRLFAVLTKFFLDLATHSAILVVIEDIHWSDDTSLDFLHYLARHFVSQRLLLLITYRHDEMHPPSRSWLTQLNRERLVREVQLMPLSYEEVGAMLAAIFDQQHTSLDMRRFLHGELLDALYTLTEGNPFFVEETISSLIAGGDIFYAQGYWNRRSGSELSIPRSVQDSVQQRTERLSEAARYVLTLAAIAGRHFDFALLQRLTGYDEQQLLLLMKELVSAQLMVEESADQFAFRHALTWRAIYTQLLARERRVLHQTIAETMEQQSPVTLDIHLEELAYHFYQAQVWQKAVGYAQRAGEKALRLYSHRAAIDYFTWTLLAADQLALPPMSMLYRARGQAYEALGEFEQAERDYTQAVEVARMMKDRTAEWQSAVDLGCLWTGRDYAQTGVWFRQALALAEALNDPALQARSLNCVGNWHLNVAQPHEAVRYHRKALTLFEQLHETHGIAETLDLLGMASYLSGDLIGGTAYYQQAVAFFSELGNRAGLTSSLATLTMRASTYHTDSLIAAASLTDVLSDSEQAVKIAREIGHRSAEAYALLQLGLCLGSQGEYMRALAVYQQSLQIAEEIEHRQWQAAAHALLGGMYSGLLALPQARDHAEQALALAQETHSLVWMRLSTGYLVSVCVRQHDYVRAETLLHAALNPDTPAQTMGQRMLWCAAVELALARGYPERALDILERLVVSSTQASEGQNGLRVLKLRGEALVRLQQLAEAEVAFEAAQELARTQGARPMQWRICIALGKLYHAQRRNIEAEQAFAMARTLIEELATAIADEPLRDNFLHLATAMLPSIRPHSRRYAARQAFGGLTAREREVAVLIAQGKLNREIADILMVSERTIETHVSNIMCKLSFTSRRQIANWVIERGLTANG